MPSFSPFDGEYWKGLLPFPIKPVNSTSCEGNRMHFTFPILYYLHVDDGKQLDQKTEAPGVMCLGLFDKQPALTLS